MTPPQPAEHFRALSTRTREFDCVATAQIRYVAAQAFFVRDKTPARALALVRAWRAYRRTRRQWRLDPLPRGSGSASTAARSAEAAQRRWEAGE